MEHILLVEKWNALVTRCRERGLASAAYVVPSGLCWTRWIGSPAGVELPPLPAAYTTFVEAIDGYPVFGLRYYDRDGWSFLPPSARANISAEIPTPDDEWPQADGRGRTRCLVTFFAGYELSDYEGWAFVADGDGEPTVWSVEGGSPVEPLGSFAEWLSGRLDEAAARVEGAPNEEVADWIEALAKETDPHRLIDYSIERRLQDIQRRTDADRALVWVVDTKERPHRYGLWDEDAAQWRLEPRPMLRVSPFTQGVAEVIFAEEGATVGGPWVHIDPDGRRVPLVPRSQ